MLRFSREFLNSGRIHRLARALPLTAAALGSLYVALSPRVALRFYKNILFRPYKYPCGDYGVKAVCGVERREIFFPANNGDKLHGWHFIQPGAGKTILLHHGNTGNLTHRLGLLDVLLKTGASVLLYDYRGYGLSQGSPTVSGVIEDGLAAYDYLTGKSGCKPDQIILYGESLGGGVAGQVAARRSCAGLILQASFCSLKRAAKETVPFIRIYPTALFPQPDLDNLAVVTRKHAPLLILHGALDAVVPVAHGDELFRKALEPKTYIRFEHADHGSLLTSEPERFAGAIKEFVTGLE